MTCLENTIAHQEKHGFNLGCVLQKERGLFLFSANNNWTLFDETIVFFLVIDKIFCLFLTHL